MDDLNLEEFIEEIDEEVEEIAEIAESPKVNRDFTDLFQVYFRFTAKHITALVFATPEQKRQWQYRGLNDVFGTLSLDKIEGGENYECGTFIPMCVAGWNAGNTAKSVTELNRWLFAEGQVEFVPILYEDQTYYWCTKVNYAGVPTLPGETYWAQIAQGFLKVGTSLTARTFPSNLVNTLKTTNGHKWRGGTCFSNLVSRAGICNTPEQLAVYAGAKNMAAIAKLIADFNPGDGKHIPRTDGRSIFANSITEWHNFFKLMSTDFYGQISCVRALAEYFDSSYGFYGELSNIAKYLTEPAVLKVKDKLHVVVEHVHIPYNDYTRWPDKCVMYAVTPEDVNAYCSVTRRSPAALAMPLTALTGSPKHLRQLSAYAAKVEVVLVFAATPIVLFMPTEAKNRGLPINSVASNLAALETEIVHECLLNLRTRLSRPDASRMPLAMLISPTETYGPGRCHVEFTKTRFLGEKMLIDHSFMGLNDIEKQTFLPTVHLADVRVGPAGGLKKNETEDIDAIMVAGRYPRKFPPSNVPYDRLYRAGYAYSVGEAGVITEVANIPKPDLANYKPAAASLAANAGVIPAVPVVARKPAPNSSSPKEATPPEADGAPPVAKKPAPNPDSPKEATPPTGAGVGSPVPPAEDEAVKPPRTPTTPTYVPFVEPVVAPMEEDLTIDVGRKTKTYH